MGGEIGTSWLSWHRLVSVYLLVITPCSIAVLTPCEDSFIQEFLTLAPDSWINSTNWGQGANSCIWFGVECDASQSHLLGLTLPYNNLTGTLAYNGNGCTLPFMESLVIGGNRIEFAPGSLVNVSRALPSLKTFDCDACRFNLSLRDFSTSLVPWTQLLELHVAASDVTGYWTPDITLPASLRSLDMSYQRASAQRSTANMFASYLSGPIGNVCGGPIQFVDLWLTGNALWGNWQSCRQQTALQTLHVSRNALQFPLEQLCFLRNLSSLDIGYNIRGTTPIPVCFRSLNNLLDLAMDNMGINGDISASLADLPLQSVSLFGNAITGGLSIFTSMPSLLYLNVSCNPFTPAPIPSQLLNLPKIRTLGLAYTNLIGSLPVIISPTLTVLDISSNKLNGAIPAWEGCTLRTLLLRSNNFTGNFGMSCAQLRSVDVSFNRITSITLQPMPALRVLLLHNNALQQMLPANWTAYVPVLHVLIASFNPQLRGALTFATSLVRYLDIRGTRISTGLAELPGSINVFRAAGSNTSGDARLLLSLFPASFPSLSVLDVSFTQVRNAEYFMAGHAMFDLRLSGTGSDEFVCDVFMNTTSPLKTLSLDSTGISTQKFTNITTCTALPSLEQLNISRNFFLSMPQSLASLRSLRVLSAAGNNFTTLPAAWSGCDSSSPPLCQLMDPTFSLLEFLDCSDNRQLNASTAFLGQVLAAMPQIRSVRLARTAVRGPLSYLWARNYSSQPVGNAVSQLTRLDMSNTSLSLPMGSLPSSLATVLLADCSLLRGMVDESAGQLVVLDLARSVNALIPTAILNTFRTATTTIDASFFRICTTPQRDAWRVSPVHTGFTGCTCMRNYVGVNGTCSKCPSPAYTSWQLPFGGLSLADCVCAAGQYRTLNGPSYQLCRVCNDGFNALDTSSSACMACPANSTGLQLAGSSNAVCACKPGFGAIFGAPQPVPGVFADLLGCAPCAANYFNPAPQRGYCLPCGSNVFSPPGNTSCFPCSTSAGVTCSNAGVRFAAGYSAEPSAVPPGMQGAANALCGSRCTGREVLGILPDAQFYACHWPVLCLASVDGSLLYCSQGHEGKSCAACSDGYAKTVGYRCMECSSMGGNITLALVAFVAYLVVCVSALGVQRGKSGRSAVAFMTMLHSFAPVLFIFINYNASMPDSMLSTFSWLAYVDPTAILSFPLACAMRLPQNYVLSTIMAASGTGATASLAMIITCTLSRHVDAKSTVGKARSTCVSAMSITSILCIVLSPNLWRWVLSSWTCSSKGNFLVANANVPCDSEDYKLGARVSMSVTVIVAVVIPLIATACAMCKARGRTADLFNDQFFQEHGFQYGGMSEDNISQSVSKFRRWATLLWHSFSWVRMLLFAMAGLFLYPYPGVQVVAWTVILAFSAVTLVALQPYQYAVHNLAEAAGYILLLLTLGATWPAAQWQIRAVVDPAAMPNAETLAAALLWVTVIYYIVIAFLALLFSGIVEQIFSLLACSRPSKAEPADTPNASATVCMPMMEVELTPRVATESIELLPMSPGAPNSAPSTANALYVAARKDRVALMGSLRSLGRIKAPRSILRSADLHRSTVNPLAAGAPESKHVEHREFSHENRSARGHSQQL